MTPNPIIELAREAGWPDWTLAHLPGSFDMDRLERFFELATAAEREKCARIVENYTGAWSNEGHALASAIRARKDNT